MVKKLFSCKNVGRLRFTQVTNTKADELWIRKNFCCQRGKNHFVVVFLSGTSAKVARCDNEMVARVLLIRFVNNIFE